MILTLFGFILQLLRHTLVLRAGGDGERNVEMPPAKIEPSGPTGLGHGELSMHLLHEWQRR